MARFCTNEGLRVCTESLGFESSDEREDCGTSDGQFHNDNHYDCGRELDGTAMKDGGNGIRSGHGHVGAKKGACNFPPPLSSMGPNGQPSVFLKPLRRDGRFLLQEVKMPRHDRLHAWRHDGRLRLQLMTPTDQSDDGCAKTSDTCESSKGDGEKLVASLDEEKVHVESFRKALGGRCHNNTPYMTSTWKPRCITT